MQLASEKAPVSPRTALWTGRVISALPVLLLFFSGVMRIMQPPEVMEGFAKFGYPESVALSIGIVEILCTLLYAAPQTAVLGAILLTGYLGGATATHVRIGDVVFAPIIVGVLIWLGLLLRDQRLRAVLPLRMGAG